MKTFTYTANDMNGNVIKGSMVCEDYNDFLARMRDRGLLCMSHKETEVKESKSVHKFDTKELAFNCRQLSAMMTSGLSLVKALDILYKEQEKEAAKNIWREIYEDVQKGQAFSEALTARNGAFPDFLISMVNAGETSGSLDTVMVRMAEHYAKENTMHNKIKGAMTYPIILLVLCVAIVIVLALFVLPKFTSLFESGGETPAAMQMLLDIVDVIKRFWYIWIFVLFIVVMVIRYVFKLPEVRLKWDRFKVKAPLVGKLIVKVYTGRFARTLSNLYSSGIPMVECLERSADVLGNTYISSCFENVVDEVKQGESLSAAIQRTGIFDSMFCSIIFVGEESGALDDILDKSSDYYEEEADSAIQRLVSYVEPCMIIFMAIMVAGVMIAILPSMYTMFENIAG